MQLKINHRLNQLLILMLLSNVAIIGGLAIFNLELIKNNLLWFSIIMFIYNAIFTILFRMLEVNWDKRLMQKMAINGQIAIANIRKAEKYTAMRDSGGNHYNIWKFDVIYWDHDMKRHEGVLFDKLNSSITEVPLGTVYITNDEAKPLNRFILQNVIIGNIPTLQPIVAKYENSKTINIRYLSVYYNKGLVIETFKTSMNNT